MALRIPDKASWQLNLTKLLMERKKVTLNEELLELQKTYEEAKATVKKLDERLIAKEIDKEMYKELSKKYKTELQDMDTEIGEIEKEKRIWRLE